MIYFPIQLPVEPEKFRIPTPNSKALLNLDHYIAIMGVLNMSPDSFYVGFADEYQALKTVEKFVSEGVDIIDVGGQSTRPGADEIPEEEEIERIKIIAKIRKRFPNLPISVDTYRSRVAEIALELGADIVNDISGGRFDENMPDICAKFNSPAIVMHITAKPKYMQELTISDEVLLEEIKRYLKNSAEKFERKGVKVVIDPGIGFGKKPHQNLMIINRLHEVVALGYPVLIGISRKSFIGFCVNKDSPPPPQERLEGTISACVISLSKGCRIFRVHDVSQIRKALKTAVSILAEKFAEDFPLLSQRV